MTMNAAFHHWWNDQRRRRESAALDRQLRADYPRWFAEVGQGGAEVPPPTGISEPARARRVRLPGRSEHEN